MDRFERAALEWANEFRAEYGGLSSLDALPPGDHSGRSCPIARALDGLVDYVGTTSVEFGSGRRFPFPENVHRFVERFDFHDYPHLEA